MKHIHWLIPLMNMSQLSQWRILHCGFTIDVICLTEFRGEVVTHASVASNAISRLTASPFFNFTYADVTKFPMKEEYVYCLYNLPFKKITFPQLTL